MKAFLLSLFALMLAHECNAQQIDTTYRLEIGEKLIESGDYSRLFSILFPVCDYAIFLGSTVRTEGNVITEASMPLKIDNTFASFIRFSFNTGMTDRHKSLDANRFSLIRQSVRPGTRTSFSVALDGSTLSCFNRIEKFN